MKGFEVDRCIYLYDHNSCHVSEYRESLLEFRKKTEGRYERGYVSPGHGRVEDGLVVWMAEWRMLSTPKIK